MSEMNTRYEFRKELIKWHNKFTTVNESFYPHFGIPIMTEKFYARHDALVDKSLENPTLCKYMDEIGKRQMSGPREIYEAPATESQMYGWLWDKGFVYEGENDRELFCKFKKTDAIMKVQMDVNLGIMRDRYYKMLNK